METQADGKGSRTGRGKIGSLLKEVGYEPSGFAPYQLSGFEKITLTIDNKRATWTKRIQRFGLVDPLLIFLARRLRMPSLSFGAQRRVDEKTIKLLK